MAAAMATLMLATAPAVSSQDSDDEAILSSESARSAAGDTDGRALLPGFYAVDSFPLPAGQPGGLDLDPATGLLWSADTSNTIKIFDHAGNVVDSFGSPGAGDGQFSSPGGIAIAEDEAFIADSGNGRVQVFDAAGAALGSHLRNMASPSACAVEVVGDLVFSGGSGGVISIHTTSGVLLDTFDGSDSGTALTTACVTDFLTSVDGEIFVANYPSDRVAVFALDGTWLRDITVGDRPTAIDTDAVGNLWVTHYDFSTVSVWTTAGTFVGQFDTTGMALGQLNTPQAIVADPSGSTFWVAEDGNDRIQIFTDLDCDGILLTQVGTSYSDTFNGTPGNDIVNLGKGFDNYDARAGNDLACAGNGHDDVSGGIGDDRILGGNGNDMMSGGGGADFLDGKQGIDTMFGNGGPDVLTGSNGFDIVNGGGGDDLLRGAKGNDTLNGNAGEDNVNGGQGFDTVKGGGGDDTVAGQNGDDALIGGGGIDDCRGGNGVDTAKSCELTIGVP